MEPGREGGEAVRVAEVGPDVGPFAQQGADEGLGFPVGLRAVGAGALGPHAEQAGRLGEAAGAVAGTVVGQHPRDGDALGPKRGDDAGEDAAAVAARSSGSTST